MKYAMLLCIQGYPWAQPAGFYIAGIVNFSLSVLIIVWADADDFLPACQRLKVRQEQALPRLFSNRRLLLIPSLTVVSATAAKRYVRRVGWA